MPCRRPDAHPGQADEQQHRGPQLEAIFDFEDMDEPFGIAETKKKDTNKKKAYYVAYLIICLKHNCGADMPGWKLIPNELQ